MNKGELISAIAEKAEVTKTEAERIVNATLEVITSSLASGEPIVLTGFGTFQVSERAARVGRNPQTGAAIEIAASKVPTFKAGKLLKEAVNS